MMVKNKGGRPRKWTVETMSKAIKEYFRVTPFAEYTMTGLALQIGSSRRVLDDYMKITSFTELISRAKLMVEHSYELAMKENGHAGNIFALKNFGWTDRYEVAHDITEGMFEKYKDMSNDDLDKRYRELSLN